jgi:P4 family phage/plasmid primase-like protien
MDENDYTAHNISTDNDINVSQRRKKGDLFTSKMLMLYAGHEDLLQEIVNDRKRYEQDDDDDNSEEALHVRKLLHIYDMYQETRVRDKDVAVSLYATCLWYIHQYINPPEIQYTELDERGNLRLLYDVIIDHLIKKYMIISVNEDSYIFTAETSSYRIDVGQMRTDINKILKQGGYSRTRQITKIINEIVTRIRDETRYVGANPFNTKAQYMVPVRNGVIVRKQLNMLMPKSPVWGFTYSLQVDYNPNAPTEPIDKFLHDIVSEEDAGILVQAVAQALLQNENYQLSYLLTGQGANGKSTYISLVTTLLGAENTTAISIQDLIEDKFKAAELQGKLMNLYADLPKTSLKTTGQFKILTGSDGFMVERKFRDPFKMVNKAVFVFSANELPEVNDATFAFWRRWSIIQFPHRFTVDPTFKDRLMTDENISGFLNMVIAKMDEIEEYGVQRSNDTERIMEEWKQRSDSVYAFNLHCLIPDPSSEIVKDELYDHYLDFCRENDLNPKGLNVFIRTLKLHVKIESTKPTINRVRVTAVKGVRIRGPNEDICESVVPAPTKSKQTAII